MLAGENYIHIHYINIFSFPVISGASTITRTVNLKHPEIQNPKLSTTTVLLPTMFTTHTAIASSPLPEEPVTPTNVAFLDALLVIEVEHQCQNVVKENNRIKQECMSLLTNNEREYIVYLLLKDNSNNNGKLRKDSI